MPSVLIRAAKGGHRRTPFEGQGFVGWEPPRTRERRGRLTSNGDIGPWVSLIAGETLSVLTTDDFRRGATSRPGTISGVDRARDNHRRPERSAPSGRNDRYLGSPNFPWYPRCGIRCPRRDRSYRPDRAQPGSARCEPRAGRAGNRILLADVFATRAQVRWLHRSDTCLVSIEGASAALRPESAYLARDGGFELCSAVLRRRLPGFDRPNFLRWDSLVLVRLFPAHRVGFERGSTSASGVPAR